MNVLHKMELFCFVLLSTCVMRHVGRVELAGNAVPDLGALGTSPQPLFLKFCSFAARTGSPGLKPAQSRGALEVLGWERGCGRNLRLLQAEELPLFGESVFSVFILIVSARVFLGEENLPWQELGALSRVCPAPRELRKAQNRVWGGSAQCLPGCPAQCECLNQLENSIFCLQEGSLCKAGRGLAKVETVVFNGTIMCLFLQSVQRALLQQFWVALR